MLIGNPRGGYAFLKGIAPYSAGAVAADGFEIVHARFRRPVALARGFERVRAHLEAVKRPVHALCAMELRSPKPFTFQGFSDFNAGYIAVLKSWDVFLEGGVNPIARTNVAPEIGPPAEPSLYAFSYTIPAPPGPAAAGPKTFIVAGGGELPEGSLDPHDVVRRGETSADALRAKTRFVMGLMTGRLKGLGVSWDLATVTGIYTVHSICPFLAGEIVKPTAGGAAHGMLWHFARPPIVSIEYEMDVRGCRREMVLEV
jgi:hypothetical protein